MLASMVLAGSAGVMFYSSFLATCALATAGGVLATSSIRSWTATVPATDPMLPWERVRLEIERARRYDSSLVVARLPLSSSSTSDLRAALERIEIVLRDTDAVWMEDRSLFLLLTGADRESAEIGMQRVTDELSDVPVHTPQVVAFPGDVLTLGGLVDELFPPRRIRPLSAQNRREEEARTAFAVRDQQASA